MDGMVGVVVWGKRYSVLKQYNKLVVYDLDNDDPFAKRMEVKGAYGAKLHVSGINSQNVARVFLNGTHHADMDYATAKLIAQKAGISIKLPARINPWRKKVTDEKDLIDATVRLWKARGGDVDMLDKLLKQIKEQL